MFTDSSRPHIAVVGRRNVGKSLLVNLLAGKSIAKVSEKAGTTQNAIPTKYELLPYGPVVIVDTAGIDDEGELGRERISETIKVLSLSDFVLLVVDAREMLQSKELELLSYLDKLQISYIVAVNKIEFGVNSELLDELRELRITHFEVSCKEKSGIDELRRRMIRLLPQENEPPLINDIISKGDVVLMIIPVESELPKRKLILSQVHLIRESLDENATVILCREKEFESTLNNLKSFPELVIIDNDSYEKLVDKIPEKIKLTTFSILISKHKGNLTQFIKGLKKFNSLKDNEKILIVEGCIHHTQSEEMSTEKISAWINSYLNKKLHIDTVQGNGLPDNLSVYSLVIHCNGCLLTHRVMQARLNETNLMNVSVINYGVLASFIKGTLPRTILPFKDAIEEWGK